MIDALIKGAFLLGTVAVGIGVVVAGVYAYNAWKNGYRDKICDWIETHCQNQRVQRILLKAVSFVDRYVAGSIHKMVQMVVKAEKTNGTQETIETNEVSIDVAKGAGCIINDNTLDRNDHVLFNDREIAAILGC